MHSTIVRYPDIEKTIPHSYYRFKGQDGRMYVRCADTIHNDNCILCKCNMEPKREDHYKKWLVNNVHVCQPGEPYDQLKIDEMITGLGYMNDTCITEYLIYEKMAAFTGMKNLSLEILSSNEFYDLAVHLVAYGLVQHKVANPLGKAKSVFRQLHKDKLRSIMVSTAYKKHRNIISKYSEYTYTCVALDEGSTSGYQVLHFVLENPLSNLVSYTCQTIRLEGLKAPDYVNAIKKGFYFIKVSKINIGSVVCDGGTAQKKAFNYKFKGSIRNCGISEYKDILFVPCLCHRISNAYKTQAETNPVLNKTVEKLHSFSSLCRLNVQQIKAQCPAHIDTRWIYDYNIASFLLKRKDTISQIVKDFPTEEINDLYKVLVILKYLIAKFETPKTQMSHAFLLLERAIGALYELSSEYKNPYAKCLAESLQKYTLLSDDGGLWALAYCLTPEGRSDFRKRKAKQENPSIKGNLKYFKFVLEEKEDNYEEIIIPENEEVLMTLDGKECHFNDSQMDDFEPDDETQTQDVDNNSDDNDDDDETIEEEEINDETSGSAGFLQPQQHTTDQSQQKEPFIDYLQKAKNKLITLLKLRSHLTNGNSVHILITNFNTYINTREEIFPFYINNEKQYLWDEIRNNFKGFEDVADIALRLLSSATSEASCERSIKKQRLIHNKRRLKSKKELLDVRMIHNSLT